jgi:predicted nucleic acid-binding protein
MRRLKKVYIETSVFNFVFADNDIEKQQHAIRLFEEINEGKYEPYTSQMVVGELLQAEEPKRSKMLSLISENGIVAMPADEETARLAAIYVAEGIIPAKYGTDALHIASTSVNDLDFIVSYNFRHIVKMKTITMTESVNLREGYRRIGIYSPTEVIENDD